MAGLLPRDHFSSRRSSSNSNASGSRTPRQADLRDPYRTPRQSFVSEHSSRQQSSSRHGLTPDYNDPYYTGSGWGSQPSSRRTSYASTTSTATLRGNDRQPSFADPRPTLRSPFESPRRNESAYRDDLPTSDHFSSRRHWSRAEPNDPRPVGRASIFSTPPGSRRPSAAHPLSREYQYRDRSEPRGSVGAYVLPDRRPSYFDRRQPSRDLSAMGYSTTERRPWR